MKLWRSTIGCDLYPGTSRPGIKSCIRILVNLHALDRRCSHAWAVRFDAVYDKRDSIRAGRNGVEKPRHGRDVILIEHRKAIELQAYPSRSKTCSRRPPQYSASCRFSV